MSTRPERRSSRPSQSLLPRRKKERRSIELLGTAAAGLLVVSIFIASSVDRYLIRSEQYASVLASVLVDLANGDRSQNSLQALHMDPVLVAAAQAKADDMAAKSYFAHVSPEGLDPWHWFKEVGYKFSYAGENLAVDFSDSGDVERAWMNSPTHRGNILDPHFTEIGIATAQGTFQGHPTTFVVQVFGAPSVSGVQGAVTEVHIPASPSETAVANATPAVLGDSKSTAVPSAPKIVKKTLAKVPSPADMEASVLGSSVGAGEAPPTQALVVAAPDYAPWWAHLMTAPRTSLKYAYWMLAVLVLLGLGIATGFEIHVHHTRKAVFAGALLSFMLIMFAAGNVFVFTPPSLTPSASTAAAASAF